MICQRPDPRCTIFGRRVKIKIEEEQIVPVGGLVFLGKSGVMSLIWSPTAGVIAVNIYASHIITNIYKILFMELGARNVSWSLDWSRCL